MADIDKVEIIRRNTEGETYSRAESVYFSEDGDKRSVFRSIPPRSQMNGGNEKQPITIGLDEEEIEVSDFEEPESAGLKEYAGSADMEV